MASLLDTFEPFKLKNRSVMAPMTRYECSHSGIPSKELQDYYIRRSENNIGLIIIESAAINDTNSIGYCNGLQFHNKEHLKTWTKVIDQIHQNGSKVFIQLFHPGRLTVSKLTNGRVLAPSAIKTHDAQSFWRPQVNGEIVHFQTKTPYKTPSEITESEINTVIQDFKKASSLAIKAGFDGVEIHGAHGYLIHQFCHKSCNSRIDKYAAESFLFVREIIQSIRNNIPADAILSFRLSQHMVDNSYIRFSEDKYDIRKLVTSIDKLGVDVFHCSEIKANSNLFGTNKSLISLVQSATNKSIIACGEICDIQTANDLLSMEQVELIAFGRLLINNPKLMDLLQNNPRLIIPFDYHTHINKVY